MFHWEYISKNNNLVFIEKYSDSANKNAIRKAIIDEAIWLNTRTWMSADIKITNVVFYK